MVILKKNVNLFGYWDKIGNYNRFVKENVSRTQSGIDPNIVFAMHELRNG